MKFIKNDTFTSSLPKPCLFQELQNNIEKRLLRFTIIFADGFDYQKGAIFGFKHSKDKETETAIKLCGVDSEALELLDEDIPVHNIGEERNVGMLKYVISRK